ncbi:hypothetical protein H5410_055374 [Solanum commersonii]|uniref:Uncharacterized protein n=1 Tax=Solanum commersonii TaxID=4109 RepID=A0A9J5WJP5_SOLCO|nr:hypothetical protein H5410_055374 [Solanum commersonii]
MRQCLQVGQEECELSHLSIHRTWNPWLHLGKTLTLSPATNSDKQMTHSESRPGCFNSVVFVVAERFVEIEDEFDSDTKLVHLSAHLMIEFKPSEQIKAHNSTDSTITTCASNVLVVSPCDIFVGAKVVSWWYCGVAGRSSLLEYCKFFMKS